MISFINNTKAMDNYPVLSIDGKDWVGGITSGSRAEKYYRNYRFGQVPKRKNVYYVFPRKGIKGICHTIIPMGDGRLDIASYVGYTEKEVKDYFNNGTFIHPIFNSVDISKLKYIYLAIAEVEKRFSEQGLL